MLICLLSVCRHHNYMESKANLNLRFVGLDFISSFHFPVINCAMVQICLTYHNREYVKTEELTFLFHFLVFIYLFLDKNGVKVVIRRENSRF